MKRRIYLQGFETDYPFVPTCKEVIYIPFSGSEVLDSFFERNIESVKALFKDKLRYDFIFIPEVVKKYSEVKVLKYFHPLAGAPSRDRIYEVEHFLINDLLHNDNGQDLAPGLVHFMKTDLIKEFEGEHKGCFEFSYFPLNEDNDEELFATLQDYVENCGETYCHINYGHPDIWQYSEADRSFYTSQERYFDAFKDRDIRGITRYIVDSLVDKPTISRMEITENGEILLSDYGMKIDFSLPLKAIYFLFLRHPEGIVLGNLADYIDELAYICEKMGINNENDLAFIAYNMIPDYDIIDQTFGEIYTKFRERLDIKAAAPYIIQASPYELAHGNRIPYIDMGAPKKIVLNRSFVSWKMNLD